MLLSWKSEFVQPTERRTLRGWGWLLKELIGEEREVALGRDRGIFLPQ